jgi:hypothetical protein
MERMQRHSFSFLKSGLINKKNLFSLLVVRLRCQNMQGHSKWFILYGFIVKRRLKTRQTVVWWITSTRLARLVDFFGLRWQHCLILCTLSSDRCGRPVLLPVHKHLVSSNCDVRTEHPVDQIRNVDQTHAALWLPSHTSKTAAHKTPSATRSPFSHRLPVAEQEPQRQCGHLAVTF